MPAAPATVGAYLASLANSHAPTTIRRRLSALEKMHRFNDLPWNPAHGAIQGQSIDVVEFLWASLALFDDDTAAANTATVYQARPFELYAVAEARERILQLLAVAPKGASLEQLLPELAKTSEREVGAKIRVGA